MGFKFKHHATQAYVSNIQRLSVHDGPGIRTTVFFIGCPLACHWCQNPETINHKPKLMFNVDKCVGCGDCVTACDTGARILMKNNTLHHDWEKCNNCGKCVPTCAYQANEMSGKAYSLDKLFTEILADKTFYNESGGGVTFSGGEPTYQFSFLLKILEKCKKHNIHTALDTSGFASWSVFSSVSEYVDLFLFDIKLIDRKKHQKYTGVCNDIILDNAIKLSKLSKEMVVRVPLIPGVNDDSKEFTDIVKFVKNLHSVEIIHLMPFHQYGSSKYKLLNRSYSLEKLEEVNKSDIDRCRSIAESFGFKVDVGGARIYTKETSQSNRPGAFYFYDNL